MTRKISPVCQEFGLPGLWALWFFYTFFHVFGVKRSRSFTPIPPSTSQMKNWKKGMPTSKSARRSGLWTVENRRLGRAFPLSTSETVDAQDLMRSSPVVPWCSLSLTPNMLYIMSAFFRVILRTFLDVSRCLLTFINHEIHITID